MARHVRKTDQAFLVATLAQGPFLPPCGGKDYRSTAAIRSAFDHRQRIMNNATEVDVHAVISFLHHLAPLRSPRRKIPQLAKSGNGNRRYPSSGDEVDGRACPEPFAFHASTSCREMKRIIPKPTVRPAKPTARR